jgi:hypothetical protein
MKEIWKDNFKAASLRVGFKLGLTRAMCEYLSAVADGVAWNRSTLGAASPDVDNFIATARSLFKRGLIEQKPDAEKNAYLSRPTRTSYELWSWTHWRLTPAGECVVQLLKLCDMFVEADVAMEKKARREGATK